MKGDMAGVVKRRILVNFRADARLVQESLPSGVRPKLLGDEAVIGVCLIRLERLRPSLVPVPVGLSGEYAAHRIAVEWTGPEGQRQEGVYIPRRDSASWMHRVGLPVLSPVRLHPARFSVHDEGGTVRVDVDSEDDAVHVRFAGREVDDLPDHSRFPSLAAASGFFEGGDRGYSPNVAGELDGVTLQAQAWRLRAMDVQQASTSFFETGLGLPAGSVEFDCALVMRDTAHKWVAAPPMRSGGTVF